MSNTQINDTSTTAYVTLAESSNNSNDIDFSNASQYVYDTSTVEIASGMCKLEPLSGNEDNYPFTTAGDYSYSSSLIDVTNGVAQLKGQAGIYAQWHLNELSGTLASDASGNSRNGSLVNMEDGDWLAGKLNNCLIFDGTNEYVNCGNIAAFERTDSFSYEFWIWTTSTTNYITIISKTPYGAWQGLQLFVLANKLAFYLTGSGTEQLYVPSTVNINNGAWHHCVITYNGNSTYTGAKIYTDNTNTTGVGTGTLTTSIVNTNNFQISGRAGTYNCFNGKLDEVLIYNKELSAAEVSVRYNSGNGTEAGGMSMDNPEITPNTGFSFTTNLELFQQTATEPTNTAIKYQISANNGTNWLYWNVSTTAWMTITAGQTNTFYYNNEANSAGAINTNIDSFTTSGIFLFRAFLHSSDGSSIPLLDNIYIKEPVTYTTIAQSVSMNYDIKPTKNLEYLSATETVTIPTYTSIQYQYSINSGTSYNGSWLSKTNLESELLSLTTAGDGTDTLRIKIRLKSDTDTTTPIIENLNIQSEAGYSLVGTYTSNIYNSGYNGMAWDTISWEATSPAGTSLIIKARSSDDNSNMGVYSTAFANGQATNLIGRYIQWIAEFSASTGLNTSRLDNLSILYQTPFLYEVSP